MNDDTKTAWKTFVEEVEVSRHCSTVHRPKRLKVIAGNGENWRWM